MTQSDPTPKATEAARLLHKKFGYRSHVEEERDTALALDAFAAKAVNAERSHVFVEHVRRERIGWDHPHGLATFGEWLAARTA